MGNTRPDRSLLVCWQGAAIGGAAGLIGAGISAAVSSNEARKQRKWAKAMYKARYQMTMDDMRKAGLNPILAARQGPGAVPSGAVGQIPNFGEALTAGMDRGSRSQTEPYKRKQLKAQADLAEGQGGLVREQAFLANAQRGTQFSQQEALARSAARDAAQARQYNAEAAITEQRAQFLLDNPWVQYARELGEAGGRVATALGAFTIGGAAASAGRKIGGAIGRRGAGRGSNSIRFKDKDQWRELNDYRGRSKTGAKPPKAKMTYEELQKLIPY